MRRTTLSLSIAALLAVGMQAKGEPDLSGTWSLEAARITRGRAPDCTTAPRPATRRSSEVEPPERRSPGCAERLVIAQTADSILIEHTSPLTPAPHPLVTVFKPNGSRATASGTMPTFAEATVYTARWQNGTLVVEQTVAGADVGAQTRPDACPLCTDDPTSRNPRDRAARADAAVWPDTTLIYSLNAERTKLTVEVRSGSNRQERVFVRAADQRPERRQ